MAEPDGPIALPGGFGTFEEICKRSPGCNRHPAQPCLFANVGGFDPLIALDRATEAGFVSATNRDVGLPYD